MELTDKIAGIIVMVAGLIFVLFSLILGINDGGLILLLFGAIIFLAGIYFLFTTKDQSKNSRKIMPSKPQPKYVIQSKPMTHQIRNQLNEIRKAVSGSLVASKPQPKTVKVPHNDIEMRKQEALRRIKAIHKRN